MKNYYKSAARHPFRHWLLLSTLVLVLFSCEEYQPVELLPANYDDIACDRLNVNTPETYISGDLGFLGPQWTDVNIEETLTANERIGSSWIDADSVITPDVFLYKTGDDLTSIFSFHKFVFDFDSAQYDSIEMHYRFHETASADFSADTTDTLMIFDTSAETKYIKFGRGLVSVDSSWNIKISDNIVSMSATGTMFRIPNKNISDISALPENAYFTGDTTGFVVAYNYLNEKIDVIEKLNLTYKFTTSGISNSSYVLFDLEDAKKGNYIFYSDNHLTFSIRDTSGTIVDSNDETISMETIAECGVIKTRTSFPLTSQKYFIRFDPHESVVESEFLLTILREE